MLPVLFYIGSVPISSLGVFLVLSFFYAMFLCWRLARAWDFDEEKVLDLLLASGIGAFLGARIYFILTHLDFFTQDFSKMVMILKYPGFSFWGAFLGGWLAFNFAVKKFRMDFWSIADIASVGFLGSLILGDIGCFLSGCGVGIQSNAFFATSIVGQVGYHFPVQIVEAIALAIVLYNIWPKATHFHVSGKILSLVLIWVGIIKFLTEFYRVLNENGQFFAAILVTLGVVIYYKISKKSFIQDTRFVARQVIRMWVDYKFAKEVLLNVTINCYNLLSKWMYEKKVSWKWRFRSILRRFNVGTYPKNT